jgi:hypothetical protein
MVMQTQTEKLKKQEKERDFFCIVRDAFRVLARHSAIALESARAFARAVLVILVWILTGPTVHFSDTGNWSSTPPRRSSPFSWCF